MKSFSRLSEAQSKLTAVNTAGNWTATNLAYDNSGLSTFRPNGYRQIELSIIDSTIPNSLSISGVSGLPSDINQFMTFAFAVRMGVGGQTTITVTENSYGLINSVTQIALTSTSQFVSASAISGSQPETFRWAIARSEPFQCLGTNIAPSYNISIEFQPATVGENFYFSSPGLFGEYDFARFNSAMVAFGQTIPAWIKEATFNSSANPSNQMFRYMDVGSIYLDKAIEYLYAFKFLDIAAGFDNSNNLTKSKLVNAEVADFKVLLWLLVFAFTKPVTSYEGSVDFIPEPFVLDDSNLNENDRLILTSYSALNPPVISQDSQTALLRWQAVTGFYGSYAGTQQAVIEAAKQMLIGNKTITIDYDYAVAPWEINITTPWNETYGGDITAIGNASNLVLEAVSYAKPLGVLINHVMSAAV